MPTPRESTEHLADRLLAEIARRQPTCGATRVIAIDGPSGSGKTDLARILAARGDAAIVHLDDLYPGWHGLDATPPMVADLLGAIAVGEVGTAARWSWVRDRPGLVLRVLPQPLIVLDGVGSGAGVVRPFLNLLVWVDAPEAVRHDRAMARDGDTYAPWWDVWAAQEQLHHRREQTQTHADVVVRT
ncbi:4-amino-4-deoxy-L-arabinose transferase [Aeromicrobium sp. CF3.5]|uniref:4-amino-4-deoxy-L-arabinose transferase n=1 Tax=Aeromicrobium sp. CF3.5 TaxID=3373078 RepID=UPI003EE4E61E